MANEEIIAHFGEDGLKILSEGKWREIEEEYDPRPLCDEAIKILF